MRKEKVGSVVFICFILLVSSLPTIAASSTTSPIKIKPIVLNDEPSQKMATVTCYIIGIQGKTARQASMSYDDAIILYNKLQSLEREITNDPLSLQIQQHQQDILGLADEYHLLPEQITSDLVFSRLNIFSHLRLPKILSQPLQTETDAEFLCNFVTTGSGSALPIIILPRLIPILLTPIPRVFVSWNTPDGVTSVGGLRSRTGFIAVGEQKGIALGFWGIGFSIFLPPVSAYGLFGYAFYARATADNIIQWPPNNPPEITGTDPADGEINIPISTTELRFQIYDEDNDLMNYNVTTNPDIGSGKGGLKTGGTYSIPINGLESLTTYTWTIQLDDGEDIVEQTLSFTTEPIAPIVSDPIPLDGAQEISLDLSELRFTLNDYQGDLMTYTVETSPDIGSKSGTNVQNGTYHVPVSGLLIGKVYQWFINVTDGSHWTRKIFSFETTYPDHFDPYEYGWSYRKQIAIDHTKVDGDLFNFPVLVSTTDSDLLEKAQEDGNDILFMDGAGVALKLNHEIERYDRSSGELIAWVNITHVSGIEDTIFYMYYGNDNCLSKENVEGTWDSNYQGVWHLRDLTTSTVEDSTINNKLGTKKAVNDPVETTGLVYKAQVWDSTEYITASSCQFSPTGSFTQEAWIKTSVNTANVREIFSQGDNHAYEFCIDLSTYNGKLLMGCLCYAGVEWSYVWGTTTVSDNTWRYATTTYDNGTMNVFQAGVLEGSGTFGNKVLATTGNQPYGIGVLTRMGGYVYPFSGSIDEVRVSKIVRSDSWIKTCYENQNNPLEFLSLGPKESGP